MTFWYRFFAYLPTVFLILVSFGCGNSKIGVITPPQEELPFEVDGTPIPSNSSPINSNENSRSAKEEGESNGTQPIVGDSCKDLRDKGDTQSGVRTVTNPSTGQRMQVYCEQVLEGGGWTMIYNSVFGVGTTEFWAISYAQRLRRKGTPDIDQNFYDGSLYMRGTIFMDVVEDLEGTEMVVLVAKAKSINTNTMRFEKPEFVRGNNSIYTHQFAGGWSSADKDGDANANNCAAIYSNVTQHYNGCWTYNLGSDADSGNIYDGGVGPHVGSAALEALGLATDGTGYSRVRRISRFYRYQSF